MKKTSRKLKRVLKTLWKGYLVFSVFCSVLVVYTAFAIVTRKYEINYSDHFKVDNVKEMDKDFNGNELAAEPCIEIEDSYVVVYLEKVKDTFRQHLGYSITGVGPVQVCNTNYLYHEEYEDHENLPQMQIMLNNDSFYDALYYEKDNKVMLRLRFDRKKAQEACTYKRTSVSVVLDLDMRQI